MGCVCSLCKLELAASPCDHGNQASCLSTVLGEGYITLVPADQLHRPFGDHPRGALHPPEMGCHASKTTQVVGEAQTPGGEPSGEEPRLEAGPEAVDGKDTPLEGGAPEPQS